MPHVVWREEERRRWTQIWGGAPDGQKPLSRAIRQPVFPRARPPMRQKTQAGSSVEFHTFSFFCQDSCGSAGFGAWQPHICELHAWIVHGLASLPWEPVLQAAGGGTLGKKGERSLPAMCSYTGSLHIQDATPHSPPPPAPISGSQTVTDGVLPFCKGKSPCGAPTY